MSSDGWIPAWRKIYDPSHWLAPSRRDPANRRDAWLDLCQMATRQRRETPSSGTLKPGELVASLRTLAKRWGWSKDRVWRFVCDLSARTAIRTCRETPDGTVYSIVNYGTYAMFEGGECDSDRDRNRDSGATAARQEQQVNKKQTTYTSDFEELWAVDGRGSKKKAFQEYRKAVPEKVELDELLAARRKHVSAAREPRFVKHLERWLRDERWLENGNGNGDSGALARPVLQLWGKDQ